ncbi:MAG TPA: DUF177 domain-containing protein [Herpetosiphonaceae bacterium]
MSDLRFNVSQLLQEHVGGTRQHEFDDPALALGDGLEMRPVRGQVKLTRTKSGVLAHARAEGEVVLNCARCLTDYQQPVEVTFDEEYHATVNVTTGVPLAEPEDEESFRINSSHLLDLGDAIREYALLALPIAPTCREGCRGMCPHCGTNLNEASCDCVDEVVDERLAALKHLLN